MMTSLSAMIGLTLASHPLHLLLAVIAIYHAGADLLGRTSSGRNLPPKRDLEAQFRSAA